MQLCHKNLIETPTRAKTAVSDASWALKKLYQLNISANGATDAGASSSSEPIKYEQSADIPNPKARTESPTGNYKKINSNKAANKESQDLGYKDAHDLKRSQVGKGNESKFDIYKDRKTGKIKLFDKNKKNGIEVN